MAMGCRVCLAQLSFPAFVHPKAGAFNKIGPAATLRRQLVHTNRKDGQ
jgi:hypothetical protein